MVKWQDEINQIVAKAKCQPQPDWEKLFRQIMPLVKMIMFMSVGETVIHSPEGRRQLKEVLIEKGWPPQKADQVLYWIIENSTKTWEEDNGRAGYGNHPG